MKPFGVTDIEPEKEWKLPANTSPALRRVIESLRLFTFPQDHVQPSFAKRLLSATQCYDIVDEINQMSKRAVVISSQADFSTSGSVHVFEVEVIRSQCALKVNEKDPAKKDAFFRLKTENLVKVIWIYSKSVNVVDAKLTVFTNYESYLKEQTIYIHHAFESAENIIKFYAYQQAMSLGTIVQSILESIPVEVEVEAILKSATDEVISRELIRRFCYGIFLRNKNITVGTTEYPSYNCRSMFTARQLKEQLQHQTLRKTIQHLGAEVGKRIVNQIGSKIKTKLKPSYSDLEFEISDDQALNDDVVNDVAAYFFPPIRTNNVLTLVSTFVWSANVNSTIWRGKVADEIYDKIDRNKAELLRKIRAQFREMCLQTVRELKAVSYTIDDFIRCVGHTEQDALVNEWKKRDILKNKDILNTHPSVQTYLAGTRNGIHVVKVFLTGDDKEHAKDYLLKQFPDVPFEFVDVDIESKTILADIRKINKSEKNAPAIDKQTRLKMNKVIQSHAEKVFANHSSIIGIEKSNVRSKNNVIVNELSIVLLCLDESILPFGESPLPESLGDYPCDVRREFVMFGHCNNCTTVNIGCSIGISSGQSAGSVGFFVKSNDSQGFSKKGFLTAAHVAIEHCDELYEGSLLLSKHSLARQSHKIIHPSCVDSAVHVVIGEVIESFFGNFGSNDIGIDAAFVQTKQQQLGEEIHLNIADENDLEFNGSMLVKKRGRTTGDTIGKLVDECIHVCIDSYVFQNCFAIEQMDIDTIFFDKGDSGSGVFVIDERDNSLKPLGIAFAFYCSKTAVCKIGEITNAFNVSVYDYEELMDIS